MDGAAANLTTNRLTLRQLELSDADALTALRSDPQVNKYLGRPASCTKKEAENFAQKIIKIVEDKQGYYWAICLKDTTELIGTICYWNIVPEKGTAEIGYELMPAYQGKGLMQEALKGVIRFGFFEAGFQTIIAMTHPDNKSSAKLLERNGFVLDEFNEFVSKENAEGLAVYVLTKAGF